MIRTTQRVARDEGGSTTFLYASLAIFAAVAVAIGEGAGQSVPAWIAGLIGL